MDKIGRDYTFDYLKGVLIFFVVVGHCIGLIRESGFNVYSDFLFILIYSFHMPLFIFISGYFFSKNKKCDFTDLLKKQFKRLLYPQFAWKIVFLLLYICFWKIYRNELVTGDEFDVKKIYHFITSMWYLWCVFFCSIITNVIFKLKYPFLNLIVLCVVLLFFYDKLPAPFFKNQQVAFQLSFFVLGIFYNEKKDQYKNLKFVFLFSLIAYVFCWFCYLLIGKNFEQINVLFKFIWSLAGCITFYILLKYIYRKVVLRNAFVVLGTYSLGVYIVHAMILYSLIIPVLSISINTNNKLLNYILVIIVSVFLVFISVFVTFLIRKSKYLKFYLLGEH